MSHLDVISDLARKNLTEIPNDLLHEKMNVKMIFLEGNFIKTLPEDFFIVLPKLMWLDLRNNELERIPESVAHHQCLENLLLTNNNLEYLPNELGLIPNLKTLQIADNPLSYPPRRTLLQGTKAILKFLKKEYENERPDVVSESEELLHIIDEESHEDKAVSKSKKDKAVIKKAIEYCADPKQLAPTVSVTKIPVPPYPTKKESQRKQEPLKIVHNLSRTGSKVSVKSYYNKHSIRNIMNENMSQKALKEGWLNKLRLLLNEQEQILQKERNLRSLSSWRLEKKQQSLDGTAPTAPESSPPPFGTYPNFDKMMNREDLAKQLDVYLKEKQETNRLPPQNRENIQRLINELVKQLKDMEILQVEVQSPRTEKELAGKQIKTIMEIHKKLLSLQGKDI